MLRRLLKPALWIVVIAGCLVIALGIIGGGWGAKPPLPIPWSSFEAPLLLAHRGLVGPAPENSAAAVDSAFAAGYPGVELDLQFAADSEFILAHDRRADRLLGLDTVLSALTSAELERQPLLLDGAPTDQHVPRLSAILDRHRFHLVFYFDLKRHGHRSKLALGRDVAALFEQYNLYETAVVASAHIWFISWLEFTNPRIVTVLEGIDPGCPWLYSVIPTRFRTDMIASRYPTVNADFLAWLRETGMNDRYITYHIDPPLLDSALQQGIRLFIIDHAENLTPYLDRP